MNECGILPIRRRITEKKQKNPPVQITPRKHVVQRVCVFFTLLNSSLYPWTTSKPSVRADSTPYMERYITCLMSDVSRSLQS